MTTTPSHSVSANLRRSTAARDAWRDKISFWLFGFNYKFCSILILSAAHDINHSLLPALELVKPSRHCFELSAGVILLANLVPAHLMLFILPKLPNWFTGQIMVSSALNMTGLLLIAFADSIFLAFIGIVLCSLACGISEFALMTRKILYPSKISEIFTTAVDNACIWSSLYYAGLRELNVSLQTILYSLVPWQVIVLIFCWFILRKPRHLTTTTVHYNETEFPLSIFQSPPPSLRFEDKCEYIGHLMKYIMPLGLIVVMQFFINQGLFEFVYFRKNFISIDSQYRWYNFIYQVGFFACTTTKTLLVLDHIWIYTVLQFLLMSFFILDAIYFFSSYLWLNALVAYLEGIFSGAAYMNTMQKMLAEESLNRLDIAENVMKQSLSLKAILGGTLAIVVHYFLCRTPEPKRP